MRCFDELKCCVGASIVVSHSQLERQLPVDTQKLFSSAPNSNEPNHTTLFGPWKLHELIVAGATTHAHRKSQRSWTWLIKYAPEL